jgi:hypothetical protein
VPLSRARAQRHLGYLVHHDSAGAEGKPASNCHALAFVVIACEATGRPNWKPGWSVDPGSLTNEQKALVGIGVALIPGLFGLAIPGGLVADSVDIDLVDIVLATLPWTASIAAITWLVLAKDSDNPLGLIVASIAILAVGAYLGVEFVPEQAAVTEAQASDTQYYVFTEIHGGALAKSGTVVAHNPRAAAGVVAAGIAAFIFFIYWILYGPALWIAGYGCGIYIGWLLYKAFTNPDAYQAPHAQDPPAGAAP